MIQTIQYLHVNGKSQNWKFHSLNPKDKEICEKHNKT